MTTNCVPVWRERCANSTADCMGGCDVDVLGVGNCMSGCDVDILGVGNYGWV
jgi:hypothetical protein